MSAQQKLAELNEMTALLKSAPHTPQDAGQWARDAVHFLRDHGHAIAELIETQAQILATESPASTRAFAELCNRRTAALRKLTQDA